MARRDLTGAVDFSRLECMAAGDGAVIDEVLEMFPEQAELWGRMLDPSGPVEAWRSGAHTLKGAALGIGAEALAAACSEAEVDAAADLGRKLAHARRVRDALDAALSDIAAYVHERALQSLKRPARR